MVFTDELREKFMEVDPAQIGHYVGGGFMDPAIKPVWVSTPRVEKCKMVGPAYTVRLSGDDSALIYYAIAHAPKGSVLVVDRCGDTTYACVGDICAECAKGAGLAGIVVDGVSTDTVGITKIDYPVFSRGISPITTKLRGNEGQVQIPVSCGGAVVKPGDIVFGDPDGVMVFDQDADFMTLVKRAKEDNEKEAEWRLRIRAGEQMDELQNGGLKKILEGLLKKQGLEW